MRNITVSLDDATYRRARIIAAERDTSLSGLVRELLQEVDDKGGGAIDRLKQRERELRERVTRFRAGERMTREQAHERRA